MNEVQFEATQEAAAEGEHALACLDAILSDNGGDITLPGLARSLYRYTDCGAWLSVKTWDGRVFHSHALGSVDPTEIRFLLVGSIVEGSDVEVCADWIDLLACESPDEAVRAFSTAVADVEDAVAEAEWFNL